ncbi:MAG: hypothetical protein JWO86_1857 [Myxococcaceae bacterium]|nr:hypothetical protein [Myxococcaceae bacterium]MEA2750439.1 hypothetical protein [Myxococcales bacterium]
MNRAVLSLPLLLACNGKVTRAECTQMLDRYIDMTVANEPERALRKGDARYVRVQEQCEAEITRREYRCAMKAPSPETWQACID